LVVAGCGSSHHSTAGSSAASTTSPPTTTTASTGLGPWFERFARPAILAAMAMSTIIWVAEAFGGIFTGQGTDPNTGLLLILLAATFWPGQPANAKWKHRFTNALLGAVALPNERPKMLATSSQ
jgi:hypothetical protein